MKTRITLLIAAAVLSAHVASAQWTFQANLSGPGENPPNGSPGTGIGIFVLNAAQTQITVDESWSGLTAPATASHIHGPAGVGTNAAVVFPFSGVPSATTGSIPEQSFSVTPTQVSDFFSGLYYFNVHTANFPGGEIRGQALLVPEPGSLTLMGLGAAAVIVRLKRRGREQKA
jgi:hypothetical protein